MTKGAKIGAVFFGAALLFFIGILIWSSNEDKKAEAAKKAAYDALSKEEKDSVELIQLVTEQKEKLAAIEKVILKKQFNELYGYHTNLVAAVKQSMNDPNSFEHDKTRYEVALDSTVEVEMYYRGKNGFGGVQQGYIRAKFDWDGNLIKVIKEE